MIDSSITAPARTASPNGAVDGSRSIRVALGDYPAVRLMRTGQVDREDVSFDFADIRPIHDAFAPMIRDRAFDLSEMAIVSALQAIAYGKPVILLPLVLASRFQRRNLVGHRSRGLTRPEMLADKAVGVRAFTQTTGMWVRAALYEDYGLTADRIRWRTRDGAHVAEYRDPEFVEHDDSGRSLPEQLADGTLAGAIMGADLPADADFAPLMEHHAEADAAFHARHGFVPINHMVVVDQDFARANAALVRAAYRVMTAATQAAPVDETGHDHTPFGFDRLRYPLGFVIEEVERQGLLPRALSVEDVFGPARAVLEA